MLETLGRYVLIRRIAAGGMGEVFLARQTGVEGFDRPCVVKVMHANLAGEEASVALFLDEARLTARLTHPHIAQVYDFGKIDGVYFLAMELVEGPSLSAVLRHFIKKGAHLPFALVARIVSHAAQGLDYAHHLKGSDGAPLRLVHRDVSPSNVLLSKQGLAKIIDFGIARARTSTSHTLHGSVRGKLAYMSPEQMSAEALDARTDIYSLGLVLYELLTCSRAVKAEGHLAIAEAANTQSWPSVRRLRPETPEALVAVVERSLRRSPAERFQAMSELSDALEAIIAAERWTASAAMLTALAEEVAASEQGPQRPVTPLASSDDATESFANADSPVPYATPIPVRSERTLAPTIHDKPERSSSWRAVVALAGVLLGLGVAVGHFLLSTPRRAELPAPGPAPAPAPVPAPTPVPPPAAPEPSPPTPEPVPPHAGTPLPAAAQLDVVTEPPVDVLVDGRSYGSSPKSLKLTAGAHRLELRDAKEHLLKTQRVTLSVRAPLRVEWRAQKGTVEVRAVPPHVEMNVTVDGVRQGATPLAPFPVWEGEHTLFVTTGAGWSASKKIVVPPGGSLLVRINDGAGVDVSTR